MLKIFIYVYIFICAVHALLQYPTYKNHICKRECDGKRRSCYYKMTAEVFYAMGAECLNCLNGNEHDCYRPSCILADGITKLIKVYNRLMPGPSIEVCQGDDIVVDIINQILGEVTTIHWHGQHQYGTTYMDGVPMITQCPILPLNTFRYNFTASVSGTHWYHSHNGYQRINGMFGSLIVRPIEEKNYNKYLYDYDLSEHVIQLTEWMYNIPEVQFANQYILKRNSPASISTILVNGIGSNFTNEVPLPIFDVIQGGRYRFRVIHSGTIVCPMKFQVEKHNLTIISTDGFDIEPVIVDAFVITNGERLDFVLNAMEEIDQYWIKIEGSISCSGKESLALLKYEGSADSNKPKNKSNIAMPSQMILNCINSNEEKCISYPDLEATSHLEDVLRGVPDVQIWLGYDIYRDTLPVYEGVNDAAMSIPAINNISFELPTANILYNSSGQKFCNAENKSVCDERFRICQCVHLIEIPLHSSVEVILVDEGKFVSIVHPMHLHGYAFRVVGQGKLGKSTNVNYVKELDSKGLLQRNLINSPLKDTISAPSGGYTILRFHASNPGYWLMHCHIEFHLDLGMGLVFKVGDPEKPPRDFPKCEDYYGDKNYE